MKDLRWGDCPGGPSAITGVLGHERRARVREGDMMMKDGWRRVEWEGRGIEGEGWGERGRLGGIMLLTLKMEKGAKSQRM